MPAWASAAPRTEWSPTPAPRAPQPASRARVDAPGDQPWRSTRCHAPVEAHPRPWPPSRSRSPSRAIAAAATKPGVSDRWRVQGDDHHRDAQRQGQPPRGADDLLLPVRHDDGLRLAHADAAARRRHRGRRGDRADRRPRAEHEVPLPPGRPQQRRHHGRRRPRLHHAQAAARPGAGRHAQPGRLRRSLDARGHALGHRQRAGARSGCSRSRSRSRPRSPTSATPSSPTPRAASRSPCSRCR